MALLVLLILGSTLGWAASILARTEAAGAILRQMAVGIVFTLAAGLIVNTGSPLGTLTWLALGVATGAAIAALAVYNLIVSSRDNAEA
ncbi:MAG: hypothetical protein SXU28_02635 [Pseudomonadota bacterium]|nr:hypothetical protein [Pseudomonadota bacterium]